ncbi:hypothetical protein ACWCQ4_25680, partial [Streptomyces aureus]
MNLARHEGGRGNEKVYFPTGGTTGKLIPRPGQFGVVLIGVETERTGPRPAPRRTREEPAPGQVTLTSTGRELFVSIRTAGAEIASR